MIVLSDRFKEAFKIALAMVITYAIALAMDWEKPFWAGLSVAFCSLATSGESINRGFHRIVGTFLAGVATVVLIALFPQERWPFLISMSALLAFLTYRVSGGSRFQFIWCNAGFNIPILAMSGSGLAASSFDFIVLRGQETALGAIVYSLVAPCSGRGAARRGAANFQDTVRDICDAQRELFGRYFGSMTTGPPDDGGAEPLRARLTGLPGGLGERLEGAIYDSEEILGDAPDLAPLYR